MPAQSPEFTLASISTSFPSTQPDKRRSTGTRPTQKTMSKQPKNGPQIIIIIESLLVWKDNDFLCPFCYAPNKKHWSSLHHSLPSVLLEIVRECLKAFHIVWDELWIKLRICHTMSQKKVGSLKIDCLRFFCAGFLCELWFREDILKRRNSNNKLLASGKNGKNLILISNRF